MPGTSATEEMAMLDNSLSAHTVKAASVPCPEFCLFLLNAGSRFLLFLRVVVDLLVELFFIQIWQNRFRFHNRHVSLEWVHDCGGDHNEQFYHRGVGVLGTKQLPKNGTARNSRHAAESIGQLTIEQA